MEWKPLVTDILEENKEQAGNDQTHTDLRQFEQCVIAFHGSLDRLLEAVQSFKEMLDESLRRIKE